MVAKLFHIFSPERAFFGQKDAAQVAVLRKMVRDLQFPVQMKVCPTVRETDGLALSSRNRNLSGDERRQALVLSRALMAVQQQFQEGERDSSKLIAEAMRILQEEPAVRVDYCRMVDPDTLVDVPARVMGLWRLWPHTWAQRDLSTTYCFELGSLQKCYSSPAASLCGQKQRSCRRARSGPLVPRPW